MSSPALDAPTEAFATIEAAQRVTEVAQLVAVLTPAFKALGVDHFVYGQATRADGCRAPRAQAGAPPAGWAAHYTSRGLLQRDAMYPRALRSSEPFTWSGLRPQLDEGGMEVLEEARAFGLADGFVVPIHHLNGSAAAVRLTGDQPFDWSFRQGATAHLLAIYFAALGARLIAAADPQPAPTLSRRQRECLQWVRGGKTDWEIAQILGLSEHTVIEHLENARRRLGVKTRAQAVIEAIARGLITV